MSYAASADLQKSVYDALVGDPTLQTLVSSAIYDALPPGQVPGLYITLGQEIVKDASDTTGTGTVHDLALSVITDSAGFQQAKEVAAAVSDVLDAAALDLTRGCLVSMRFVRAVAKRDPNGRTRRITMTFRARIENT